MQKPSTCARPPWPQLLGCALAVTLTACGGGGGGSDLGGIGSLIGSAVKIGSFFLADGGTVPHGTFDEGGATVVVRCAL